MSAETLHKTLVLTRIVPAPPKRVFEAHADAGQRTKWGVPSETAVLIYDQDNFRIGGMDRFRCGSKDDPKHHGTTVYLDIAQERRIVSSEVITVEGKSLSAALTTVELSPHDRGTALRMTVQVASFVGPDMINGHEQGYNGALDNLVGHFEGR